MSNYTRTYAMYTAWSLATTLLSGVLFYVVRIVLFQRLSTETYAEFYSGMAFALLLHPFLSLGFDPGLAPHLARWREEGAWGKARGVLIAAASMQFLLAMALWAMLWMAAEWIAPRVIAGADPHFLRVMGGYVLAVLLYKIAITSLLGFSNIAAKNIVEMVRVVFCAGAMVIVVHEGARAHVPAFVYIGATGFAALFGLVALFTMNASLRAADGRWYVSNALNVIRTGLFATIAFGGVLVFSQLDTVMLTMLRPRDAVAVAAYQVAVPTFMILQSVLLALANNFIPVTAALDQRGDHERLGRAIGRAYEGGWAIVLPAAALMIPMAGNLVALLFRREVAQATGALQLLGIAAVFVFIAYFNLHALTGLGRTRAAAMGITVALVANVLLNFVLIPRWSLYGAAGATVVSYMVAAMLTAWSLRSSTVFRVRLRSVMWIGVVTLVCFALSLALARIELAGWIALGAAGLVYLCAIALQIRANILPSLKLGR